MTFSEEKQKINKCLCEVFCFGLIIAYVLFIYRDYIFGEKLFIFTDIAFDSASQTYPNLLYHARRLHDGMWGELVNFCQGIGNREVSFVPDLGNWFCVLGEDKVASFIGIIQVIKVVLTGLVAYLWAKEFNISIPFCLIISIAAMSSPDITIRSAWYSYPNTTLLMFFWLLAFEVAFRKKKFYILPIATVLLFYSVGIYYCLVWGAFFCIYICLRFISNYNHENIKRFGFRKCLVLFSVFWLLGSLDNIFSSLDSILTSSRFQNGVQGYSLSISELVPESKVLITAFLRTFGQTINGLYSNYHGNVNFLEDPAFYLGILLIVTLPVAYVNLTRRKKLFYGIWAGLGVLYLLLKPLRIVANGFNETDTFKTSSFWLIILFFLLALELFASIRENNISILKSIVILWLFNLLVIALLSICRSTDYVVNDELCHFSIMFCVIYGVLFTCYLLKDKVKIFGIIIPVALCFCCLLETYENNYRTIAIRNTFSKKYIDIEYYNDGTTEAIEAANTTGNGFHRIEKQYSSIGNCDSLAQQYYGTKSYIGIMEADPSIQTLYNEYNLPTQMGMHHLLGTGGNIYMGSLLGVEYYFSKSDYMYRYGYEHSFSADGIRVCRNSYSLPLVYKYEKVMEDEQFRKINAYDRSRNVLKACTVTGRDLNIETMNPVKFDKALLHDYKFDATDSARGYYIEIPSNYTLIVVMKMSNDNSQTIHYVMEDDTEEYDNYRYTKGENIFEITCADLKELYFSDDMRRDVQSIEFYVVESEKFYSEYRYDVDQLKKTGMQITMHDEIYNNIEGYIYCNKDCVMSSSIPYNNGWRIKVDNKEVEVLKINQAFLGCYLSEGNHKIQIYYEGKTWIEANIIKSIGFIFSIAILVAAIFKNKSKNMTEMSFSNTFG